MNEKVQRKAWKVRLRKTRVISFDNRPGDDVFIVGGIIDSGDEDAGDNDQTIGNDNVAILYPRPIPYRGRVQKKQ